jgi:hypothetical protein
MEQGRVLPIVVGTRGAIPKNTITHNHKPTLDINIAYNDNLITTVRKIKFLGIYIHDSLNWNCHIEYIIPKLSSSFYIITCIKPFMSPNTLKNFLYSYFNEIMSYGLPFGGDSPHDIKVFRMQNSSNYNGSE